MNMKNQEKMTNEVLVLKGICCPRGCGGFLQSVNFLDGTSIEYCNKCDYVWFEVAPLIKINGKLYHSHYPERCSRQHLANMKHKPRVGEFESFEEWKKTNPKFKNSDLKPPIPKALIKRAWLNEGWK
jgi:Zn-finger nucleic acid-binding protein